MKTLERLVLVNLRSIVNQNQSGLYINPGLVVVNARRPTVT